MKKLIAVITVLVMLLSLTAVLAEDTQEIALGTSGFAITVPAGYIQGEISAEDTDESQVAYYKSEASLVDFDIYQWAKADGETLETVAAAEAAEYDAVVTDLQVNDITVWFYLTKEEADGVEYETVSYLMENGDYFAEIVFWLDGENATETVDAIIGSIAR